MTLEELEKRVQVLEDLEEIKKLRPRYAKYADENYNPEKLAELFTEEAVWDGGVLGQFRGREAIKKNFAELSQHIVFACHWFVAPDINIEGSKARGTWYGMNTGILRDGRGFWSSCFYHDEYSKIDGKWFFNKIKVIHLYRSPYEGGWAKEKQMSLKVEDQA